VDDQPARSESGGLEADSDWNLRSAMGSARPGLTDRAAAILRFLLLGAAVCRVLWKSPAGGVNCGIGASLASAVWSDDLAELAAAPPD
jgi:hypothetical protein